MSKVAILQSNYIPWKGYFDIINLADTFILYDQAQYTKNDWRNRNLIQTPQGSQWLTIPVKQTSLKDQRIDETLVANNLWRKKHWKSLQNNYNKSKYFKHYSPYFYALYLEDDEQYLSKINYKFIKLINKLIGITTEIVWSLDYTLVEGKTERLVKLCQDTNATQYISGLSAKSYLDSTLFDKAGIDLIWMEYKDYPCYQQLFSPFIHQVSIIDLLFNYGPDAKKYMLTFT